ncbi:MAG: N-acetylmuramoyl-L-alanine amidase [Clostridium sp.]|nr:N-acetylmuramoyl-L-alanine amidase [Clostridium sp.]
MAILKPDKTSALGGVTVNEYLLTKHNPNKIDMPSGSMDGKILGVTIHNTDWISVASSTTPAEQYTRATVNGNMGDVRVHYYVDNKCAWQNLPITLPGWHAADGNGNGNRRTIAIECIMSSKYNYTDKKSEDNAAKLAAALLMKYNLGIDSLYTHNHWYSKKYCPAYILPHWDSFKAKVKSYMNTGSTTTTAVVGSETAKKYYRVRKTWADSASQIGAFTSLDNAKNACKEGYSVFDWNGKSVYTKSAADTSIKKGDSVKVKSGAKDYNGGSLASFVYKTTYAVLEVNGDRVVIGLNGLVTAAVHKDNLLKV